MKKHFLAALAILGYLLFAFLIITYAAEAKEGSRVLDNEKGFTVEVPEMCPDFLFWQPRLLGSKQYANGNGIAIIESRNEEETVFVTAIWAKIENKAYCLGLIITYFPPKGFDPKKKVEDQMKSEYIEDIIFMRTGKPSGVLSRVKDLTPFSQIERFLNRLEV